MKLFSIFDTIDGEINAWAGIGSVTTFVRLYGCNLRCDFCDSKNAVIGGKFETITPRKLFIKIAYQDPVKITITGGEPFTQAVEMMELFDLLIEWRKNIRISVETNGQIKIPENFHKKYAHNIRLVMDYKLPNSKNVDLTNEYCKALRPSDVLKFVFRKNDKKDFDEISHAIQLFSRRFVWNHTPAPTFAFSPVIDYDLLNQPIKFLTVIQEAFIWVQKVIVSKMDRRIFPSIVCSMQLHKLLKLKEDTSDANR